MNENGILLGIAIFLVVILPILIIRDVRHRRKIRQILDSHRKNNKEEKKSVDAGENQQEQSKGWGMNNSPFRSRKSGLTWNGGNMHASYADRGKRSKPSR